MRQTEQASESESESKREGDQMRLKRISQRALGQQGVDDLLCLSGTHKKFEELEDPLVGEDVERVSCQRVYHRQPVDLVLDQRRYSII